MGRLNYEDRAEMVFSQIDIILAKRIRDARECWESRDIVTSDDYPEKIRALEEVRRDIDVLRRAWL